MPSPVTTAPQVTALAVTVLRDWTRAREHPDAEHRGVAEHPAAEHSAADSPPDTADPGVPALAALLATARPDDPETIAVAAGAVASWARTAGRGSGHPGLFSGGLAGTLAGLRLGALLHPALNRAADRLHTHLAAPRPYRTTDVTITDYDFIMGPAGTLQALLLDGAAPPPAPLDHLALLCADPDLGRLRAGRDARFPELEWLEGRVNTGMGHGAAGLLTALTAAARRTGDPPPALTRAIGHLTRWLTAQSFPDARAIRSWDGAGLDGPPPPGARARQAWCYGAPGICWALWDAADATGDRETADWAASAFTTLCAHYDESFHLYGDPPTDRLGCCHGAAGVLAVADAFHRHARHRGAAALRTRLTAYLTDRSEELPALAAADMGLLGGAPGVLCALLTAADPAGRSRTWLHCLGLR
ncbi:lanthionine synthetase LanC family protein [Streptomyces sp. NPDC004610]|uniref:lanthionine synthetase LanC family protein n=1 Tax=unclassified Streptomyces TaxID=2593676 RepID=UPI0033B7F3C5